MPDSDDHKVEEIIENLASRLYFHGHPINRKEARDELRLDVSVSLPPELETAMWDLYKLYEADFKNLQRLRIVDDLMGQTFGKPLVPGQVFDPPVFVEHELVLATVESSQLSSRLLANKRYVLSQVDPKGNPMIREETVSDGWDHKSAQEVQTPTPPSATAAADAPSGTAAQ